MGERIIIDYNEYKNMKKTIKEAEELKTNFERSSKKQVVEYAPGCVRSVLLLDTKFLKELFKVDEIEVLGQ